MDTLENGLQVELNETAPCCFTLKALIPAAEVSKTYADVLTKYIAKTRTPGFRAGRAPKALVEKMHGADIKADASQTLVTRMLDEAMKKYRLRPSSQIEFADDKAPELSKDADMAVGFKFEAYANFELPDYAGMALENPEEPVDEKKVDEAMETFLHTCGTYKTVDREAAAGDMLKVDYTCDADQALRDDKSASYMLKGENSWMVLREGAEMLPGITAALAGLKAGDSKDAELSFPEDFRVAAMAGKTINFHFTVKEVQGFTAPELNEEFFKRYNCSSEDEMRSRMRERISMANRERGYSAMVQQATDKLLTMVDFPLPPETVAREAKEIVTRRLEARRREKIDEAELAEMLPQIEAEAKAMATRNLKLSEILRDVASKENAQVNDFDIYQYCSMVAQEHGTDIQTVINQVKENRDLLNNIIANVTEHKALNAVLSKASITYTDPVTAAAKAAEKAAMEAEKAKAEGDEKPAGAESAEKSDN